MNAKPRFSILICAYNAEKYIVKCLKSIIDQEFSDYEIIVIDDGSTDDTYKICKKIVSKYKAISIYHWDNHGLILSRRKALSMASGEYILFLDADDFYLPNALGELNKQLNEYKNPDMLLFRFKFLYENGTIKNSRDFSTIIYYKSDKNKLLLDTAKYYEYNHLWCKAIKRELIMEDNQNYETCANVQLGEDLLQTIPLILKANKVIVSPVILYGYRVTKNSMAHFFSEKQIDDINYVYENIIEKQLTGYEREKEIRKAFIDAYLLKIFSLWRISWESNIQHKDKIKISNKILKLRLIQRETLNLNNIPIQNRVFYFFSRMKLWKIMEIYSKLLRNTGK